MTWQEEYQRKMVSVATAAEVVKSGDIVFTSAGPSCPIDIINAISARYKELENVHIASGLLTYPFEYLKAEYKGHITHHSGFLGPLERMFMPQGNIRIRPYQFSKVDKVIPRRHYDVGIFEVSTPDNRGYMSFGPQGTFSNAIISRYAGKIIVQVNSKTPFVNGMEAHIHVSQVDYICEKDHDLIEIPDAPIGEEERKLASYIVDRIPDGACIQLGFGKIANAVGFLLESKKDLGVHSEMLTNSMMVLAQKGVITCAQKNYQPGTMVCSFAIGPRALYDFMDHNPMVIMLPIYQICTPETIAKIDNFVSINNALCVDLMGQVGSESIGFTMYSGTGGQLDFVRGAAQSKGGQSFIALLSTAQTKNGLVSRINTALPLGTIVTTPRTDVQCVVTEYGVADLMDLSLSQSAEALIAIAHPAFRDQLRHDAKKAGLLY
ncbi:MAG: acetyl-CoA hydrolase/transferase C-terminal domain-containing protein [Smithella sp.]|jgi:4-hydroxybutyrate CoA-transferase